MDREDDGITLDNWTPSDKELVLQKSGWRTQQNANKYNLLPGADELRKINAFLKKKYPDYQIMEAFGINCDILMAIKHDCYSPIRRVLAV